MEPTFADFSTSPARLSTNAEARYHHCRPASSHLALNADARVELDFEVDGKEEIIEATLKVTALVSKLGRSPGFAPIDVLIQGEVLAAGLTVPGGGDLPQDNVFAVPGRLLHPGTNTLEIRTSADARSMLWLYRVTLDSVYERGRSERAMAAEAARESVFAYRTERRAPYSSSWEPGPRLLFHVDRGEQSLPAQLGWGRRDGAESAISFQSNMSDFYGQDRAADGTLSEFRGRLTGTWAFPEGTENAHVHRFRTEEGWGGGWHTSGELRLLVDDEGSSPVERVTWRDQRGNSAVAALRLTAPAEASAGPRDVTGEVIALQASDEHEDVGEVAHNLLDTSQAKWLAGHRSARLDLSLARPTAVTSYALRSANDFPGRDPREWTLSASHDGRTWTRLDSRTGQRFTDRFQTRDFTLTGPHTTAYRHYRLDITHNAGADEVQLCGVRLFGATADDFSGYYQRYNEGPIGYRGTAALHATATDATSSAVLAVSLAAELERAARSLADAAQSVGRLAAWVKDR
ncbi:alpha-1,2-mannosidase [Streptomyces sp. NPDC052236]|uniref:alpha-1,2-mannosidase n=1 Tax=Streptomyces sp. NPDC052236 TaxID=3365686 RepID=UPI0037D54993